MTVNLAEERTNATVVWRQKPGEKKILAATITVGSKFRHLDTSKIDLGVRRNREAVAKGIIDGWRRSGHYPLATAWSFEERKLFDGKVDAN